MNLLTKSFLKCINETGITKDDKLLLAVSGGVDSMLMAHIFHNQGFNISIAHANFGLRGKDSDEDEKFVQAWARKRKVPFYTKKFTPQTFIKEQKCSLQEACRILRYDWFEQLRKQHQLSYIVTAHHWSDNTESLLHNLFRSPGLNALTGIKIKDKKLVRPMMFMTKKQILQQAVDLKIDFRHDTSNDKTDYKRNLIRNNILPDIYSNFELLDERLFIFSRRMLEVQNFAETYIQQFIKKNVEMAGEDSIITLDVIHSFPLRAHFFYVWLKPFGFSTHQIEEISTYSQNPKTGKIFDSHQATLLFDRGRIVLTCLHTVEEKRNCVLINEQQIEECGLVHFNAFRCTFSISTYEQVCADLKTTNKHKILVDYEKLSFPLKLRYWKEGDKFIPFGQQTYKKLSRFFVSEKVAMSEKYTIPLLCSNDGNIVWVCGYRADDRYKVSTSCNKVLIVECSG